MLDINDTIWWEAEKVSNVNIKLAKIKQSWRKVKIPKIANMEHKLYIY